MIDSSCTLMLAQARRLDSVLRLMDGQAPKPSTQGPTGPNGSWLRYRNKVHHAG